MLTDPVADSVALPDLVPARMVNEYAYCPRLAYLEWVQGDWADNADTAEGRFRHRVVDQEKGDLPAPGEPDAGDSSHRSAGRRRRGADTAARHAGGL
jgi:hypothetical protein